VRLLKGRDMYGYGQSSHTKRTKETVTNLFNKGLSAREVAKQANKLCKDDILNPLTKNAVIGIRNRAGQCVIRNRVYGTYTPRNKTGGYDKSLAFNEHKQRLTLVERQKQRLMSVL